MAAADWARGVRGLDGGTLAVTGPPQAPARRRRPPPRGQAAGRTCRAGSPSTCCAPCDERDAYANLTLPGLLRERGLDARDAAFATELAYGTLRGRGTYDAVLAACVDRPLDQVDPPVLDLLRLGAHQLLAMRVPVARRGRRHRRAGPRGGRRGPRRVRQRGAAQGRPAGPRRLAGRGRPGVRRPTRSATSRSSTRTRGGSSRRCATPSAAPWTQTAAAAGRGQRAAAGHPGGPARPGHRGRAGRGGRRARPAGRRTPPCCPAATPAASPRCATGRAGVQDEGSQLVALALAAAPVDGRGRALAGPVRRAGRQGGPARAVAAGARRRACSPPRSRRTGPAWSRRVVGDTAGVVVADGRVPAWRRRAFDRVLVDAPCTGLGALRRRPEARWRRQPEDVAGLTALQRELLRAGLDAVRPGGLVAYVTCSPHLAETRSVVAGRAAPATGGRRPGGAGRRPAVPARRTRPRRRPGRAALAAPARHRRDVPRACCVAAEPVEPVGSLDSAAMGVQISPSILSADFTDLAAEVARIAPARRLGARRRDGQPLRAQPDDRAAGRRAARRGQRRCRWTCT